MAHSKMVARPARAAIARVGDGGAKIDAEVGHRASEQLDFDALAADAGTELAGTRTRQAAVVGICAAEILRAWKLVATVIDHVMTADTRHNLRTQLFNLDLNGDRREDDERLRIEDDGRQNLWRLTFIRTLVLAAQAGSVGLAYWLDLLPLPWVQLVMTLGCSILLCVFTAVRLRTSWPVTELEYTSVLISVVLVALLTRRFAFALALPSVIFGGLLMCSGRDVGQMMR